MANDTVMAWLLVGAAFWILASPFFVGIAIVVQEVRVSKGGGINGSKMGPIIIALVTTAAVIFVASTYHPARPDVGSGVAIGGSIVISLLDWALAGIYAFYNYTKKYLHSDLNSR